VRYFILDFKTEYCFNLTLLVNPIWKLCVGQFPPKILKERKNLFSLIEKALEEGKVSPRFGDFKSSFFNLSQQLPRRRLNSIFRDGSKVTQILSIRKLTNGTKKNKGFLVKLKEFSTKLAKHFRR
jgi:hypothetical protein